jgi:hypothetical protein
VLVPSIVSNENSSEPESEPRGRHSASAIRGRRTADPGRDNGRQAETSPRTVAAWNGEAAAARERPRRHLRSMN